MSEFVELSAVSEGAWQISAIHLKEWVSAEKNTEAKKQRSTFVQKEYLKSKGEIFITATKEVDVSVHLCPKENYVT